MDDQPMSFTTTKKWCNHRNGWHKTVNVKWWLLNFKAKVFLCADCEDIIPLDEAERIWKSRKDKIE